jgi:hypothetical protein
MPAGRPKADIDNAELEKLCAMQCTDEELAAFFGVCTRTIERLREDPARLEIMNKGYGSGRISLRRAQLKYAHEGNPALLIWLGKTILGQKEIIENRLTGKDGKDLSELSEVKQALLHGTIQAAAASGTDKQDNEA